MLRMAVAGDAPTPDHSLYDPHYHDDKAAASRHAADVILPIVFSVVAVESVVDVGCGYGNWLAAARALGVTDLTGIEGPWAAAWRDRDVLATEFDLVLADLEAPLRVERTYDLVICIEVVEHLTARRAPGFVADLCAAGETVLLGAAIPGQRGPNHVHERWLSQWAADFAQHGYEPIDCIRPRIWGDPSLWTHHRQNPVLFVAEHRGSDARARAHALPEPGPDALDVVHPDFLLRTLREEEQERQQQERPPTLGQHLRLLANIPAAVARSVRYRAHARATRDEA